MLRSSGRPVFQTLAPSPDNADAACGSEELGLAMTGDIAPTAASLPDATPAGDDTVFDGLCFALIELENPRVRAWVLCWSACLLVCWYNRQRKNR